MTTLRSPCPLAEASGRLRSSECGIGEVGIGDWGLGIGELEFGMWSSECGMENEGRLES